MSDFVALNYIEEYDVKQIETSLRASFSSINACKDLKAKAKVLVLVNAPQAYSPNQANSTHPAVVSGVVNVLSEHGVNCIVAVSPYKSFSSIELDEVYISTGMLDVANSTKCELNRNLKTFNLPLNNGVATKSVKLLDIVNQVDAIVNIGKVKVDDSLGYLGATSNLFGLIPGEYKTLMLNRLTTLKDFNNLIIDLYFGLKNKLVLNVLDGIVSLEAGKSQRMLSCLAVAENPFKLDASLIKILNIPYENTILNQAEKRGLINLKYPFKLLGEGVDKFIVEDFAVCEFDENSKIHKNESKAKAYFNRNQQRPIIKPDKCKGCKVCSKICPTGAIMMKVDKNGELYAHIDYSKCIFCFKCHTACPYSVVDVKTPVKYKMLMKQIDKQNKTDK